MFFTLLIIVFWNELFVNVWESDDCFLVDVLISLVFNNSLILSGVDFSFLLHILINSSLHIHTLFI